MRRLIVTLYASALCLWTGHAGSDPFALESLSWLEGCWGSVNGEPGSGEYWTPLAGASLFGISRTVEDGETVAFEFLQIRRTADGAIELIAQPSGQTATKFRLTGVAENQAVFENPGHDFPQRITYELQGSDKLSAWIEGTVSGQFKRVDFPMVRTHSAALCPRDQ